MSLSRDEGPRPVQFGSVDETNAISLKSPSGKTDECNRDFATANHMTPPDYEELQPFTPLTNQPKANNIVSTHSRLSTGDKYLLEVQS
jgi:hypothetical protein